MIATANHAPALAVLIVPLLVYGPVAVVWAVIRRGRS